MAKVFLYNEILDTDESIKQQIKDLEEEEEQILNYLAQHNVATGDRIDHYRSKDFFELTIDR